MIAISRSRAAQRLVLLILCIGLAACGLPRKGPYYEELTGQLGEAPDPAFSLVPVTADVVAAANMDERLGFQVSLTEAEPEKTSILGVGDELQITIWERGENGLYAPLAGATALSAEIEESGRIFLPYVGEVRAAGRTAAGLRRAIAAALADKTLDPQVEVRRATGDSKSVTITGSAGVSAVMPIERTTRTLLSLLAKAGVAVEDPDVVTVRLRRGALEGRIWLRDLYETAANDIPVRAGDVILLDTDNRHFRALGAIGQARVPFPTRDISVLDAMALVGGLNPAMSDPSGVFLFRTEPAEVAARLSVGAPGAARNVGYLFDLTSGGGLFLADAMRVRDGDLIYVTDAPFTRFQIIASSLASTVGFAGSVGSIKTAGSGF